MAKTYSINKSNNGLKAARLAEVHGAREVNWVRESTARVRRGADRGNCDAAYELACRLLTGRDVAIDAQGGYDWARYAARKGHVKAQMLVGYCLVRGVGTSADGISAVHWFQRAARQGSVVAFYNLGCCYLVGIGLPKSRGAAVVYFQAAAQMGYAKAAAALARLDVAVRAA